MRRFTLFAVLVFLLSLALPTAAQEEKRRKFVEDLFKAILESRGEQSPQPGQVPPGDPRQLPPQARRVPQPGPAPAAISPQIQNYRKLIPAFAQGADALAGQLYQSTGRVPGVRAVMPQAISIKSQAAVLADRSRNEFDLQTIHSDYTALDTSWRDFAYQLQRVQGLGDASHSSIKRLNGYSDQLCDVLGIQSQFDRQHLATLSVQATAYIDSLLQNVEFELYFDDSLKSLLSDGRQLEETMRQYSHSAYELPYDECAAAFGDYISHWQKYSAKLYPHKNHPINRSLARVRRCHRDMHAVLRTSEPLDRQYLASISHLMTGELKLLFEQMNVSTVVALPQEDQRYLLDTAQGLLGRCQQYCGRLDAASEAQLVADLVEIDADWTRLAGYLGPVRQPEVTRGLLTVQNYLQEIRLLLNVPDRVDRQHVLQLAASLDQLSESYYANVYSRRKAIRSSEHRDAALKGLDAFRVRAHQFHEVAAEGSGFRQLQSSCHAVLDSWQQSAELFHGLPGQGLNSRTVALNAQQVVTILAELAATFGD